MEIIEDEEIFEEKIIDKTHVMTKICYIACGFVIGLSMVSIILAMI